MAEDSDYAISAPGSNLWGQTFMKRTRKLNSGGGEYTYTSELKNMKKDLGHT